jgi:hypothetical protein
MRQKGLGASRIRASHLVVSAVLNEAVRDKMIAESPCSAIELPGITVEKDFILPTHAQLQALARGLPADWAATVWLMNGCGLRIGEALAVNARCLLPDGTTLRVWEQVDQLCPASPAENAQVGRLP